MNLFVSRLLRRARPPVRAVLLLGLGLGLLTACEQAPTPALRLGTNLWPGYEPLFLARELGYLDASEITLIELPSATDVLRELSKGTLDAAALTLDEVLGAEASGLDLTVFLVTDISNGADVILSHPDYPDLPSLVGKRIGVESTALGALIMARASQLHGLTPADFDIRGMDVSRHVRAYLDNEVDAVVTFEPARTAIEIAGAVEVFSSRAMPGEIVDVLVARPDALAERASVFANLLDAWEKAVTALRDRPAEVLPMVDSRVQIGVDALQRAYQGMILPDTHDNDAFFNRDQRRLSHSVDLVSRIMVESGLLDAPIAPDDVLIAPEDFQRLAQ